MERGIKKYCVNCPYCRAVFFFNMDLSTGDNFDACRDGLVIDGDKTRIGMMCFCKKKAEDERWANNCTSYFWIDSSDLEESFGEQLNNMLAVRYNVVELPSQMKKYTDEYVNCGLFKRYCEDKRCPYYAELRLEEWNEE